MENNCNYLHMIDKNSSKPKVVLPRDEAANIVRSKLADMLQLSDDLKNVKNQKSLGVLVKELNQTIKDANSFILSEFSETVKQSKAANLRLSNFLDKYNAFGTSKQYVVLEMIPNNPVEDNDPPCAGENVHFKHSIDLNNVSFIPHMNVIASSEKELESMFAGKYIIPIRCTDCSSGRELVDISAFIERIFGQKLTNMKPLDDKDLENFKEFGTLTPTSIDDRDDDLTEQLVNQSRKELSNDIYEDDEAQLPEDEINEIETSLA